MDVLSGFTESRLSPEACLRRSTPRSGAASLEIEREQLPEQVDPCALPSGAYSRSRLR